MSTEDEIHIFANLVAKAGQEDAVRAILKRLVAAIEQESGVVHYAMHEDIEKPGAFHFFEAYEDEDAVTAHMNSPHLAHAFKALDGLLAGTPTITRTRLIAGG